MCIYINVLTESLCYTLENITTLVFLIDELIFLLYNIVFVLPYIDMNPPWVYTCSPSWTPLPPPSPSHPSGSSQCTSPEHPVSCIEPGLAICFTYDNIHVSMLFSQIIPLSPSPTESKSLFFISVSFFAFFTLGCHYHLSKFHIYALIYCTGVFLFDLLHYSPWVHKESDETERLHFNSLHSV